MNRPGHIQIIAPERVRNVAKRSGGGVVQPVQGNAGPRNFAHGFPGGNLWMSASFRECGLWHRASV